MGYVYFIGKQDNVKIGWTEQNPFKRMKRLHGGPINCALECFKMRYNILTIQNYHGGVVKCA